jgi:hypothetical protein
MPHQPITTYPYFIQEEKIAQGTQVLLKILDSIERVFWDNKTITQRFAQESARTVLKNKEIYPLASCLPLSMIAADYFYQQQGIHSNFIVEELYDQEFKRTRKHLVLQLPADKNNFPTFPGTPAQQNFIIDFSHLTNVQFYRGDYVNAKGNKTENLTYVTQALDPTKTFQENYKSYFPQFNEELKKEIAVLCSINKPEIQENIRKQYAEQPRFTLYYRK